jgi:acyl phosphate:glycerol-3-phosphate acyltransferase
MIQLLLAVVGGYIIGAIPSGALVARLYGRVDLTRVGSQKTGATNVLRTLGPKAAAIVFIGDVLKGVLPTLAARLLVSDDSLRAWAMSLAGLAAVLGHAYSVFIGFKGGRGVSTGLGALAVIEPPIAGLAFVVGAIAIAATRYVSLGSILGTSTAAVALLIWAIIDRSMLAAAVFGVAIGIFIVVAHRDNIDRLRTGTERKLGERVSPTAGLATRPAENRPQRGPSSNARDGSRSRRRKSRRPRR